MMPAATHFDPVIGVDVHMIQPPGPVPPVPIPHPYIGIVIDYADYAPIIGSTIKVNGLHRAIAGTSGKGIPKHIPIGGMFVPDLPASEHEDFMGSATVEFDGDAATYLALPCLSCQSVGIPPIPRLNPKKGTKLTTLVLPTSVVLPIPKGPPVLIGGPPTISLMSVAMHLIGPLVKALGKTKVGQALGKYAKKGEEWAAKKLKSAFKWMPDGFIKCKILKAEPVDIRTGEVIVLQQDFELPGRIPIRWPRRYGSNSTRVGVCGRGWDTQADARLELQQDGSVLFLDGEGVGALFEALPHDGPVREPIDAWLLDRAESHYTVCKKSGLTYYFPVPAGDWREALVEALVDSCRNSLHFVRGPEGLEQVVESAGRRLEIVSQNGLVRRIVLHHPDFPEQRTLVRFAYDREGALTAVYDALDHPYTFQYWEDGHARGRLNRHTNRTGLSFYYEYDEAGRCVHGWGDGGFYDYHFKYDSEGRWTNYTDSLGHPWSVEMDERGQIASEVDPLGGVTSYTYDEVGRTSSAIDPGGRTTQYKYDNRGNLTLLTRADGSTTENAFDKDCLVKQTDPLGHAWTLTYDTNSLLNAQASPRGHVWLYQSNNFGDVEAIHYPGGGVTFLKRDSYGSIVEIVDPAAVRTTFLTDILGAISTASTGGAPAYRYRYDAKGRLLDVTRPEGGVVRHRYNDDDHLVAWQDARGHLTKYERHGLGEIRVVSYPNGESLHFEYDCEERIVGIINERRQRHSLLRDPIGRVIMETDYWGGQKHFEYNFSLKPISEVSLSGRLLQFSYDAMGRLIERSSNDSIERYIYDGNGQLLSAKSPSCVVERDYDADGNMISEQIAGDRVANEFDALGHRITRVSSLGHRLDYKYDSAARLASIKLDDTPLVGAIYNECGLVRELNLGTAVKRVIKYDADRNRRGEEIIGPAGSLRRQFAYDQNGHIIGRFTEQNECSDELMIDLDAVDRVARWRAEAGFGETVQLDSNGTRLHQTTGDLLVEGGWSASVKDALYRFDADGRLVTKLSPRGTASYSWDAFNRLRSVELETGQRIEFDYDALGRRITKRGPSSNCRYHWDFDLLLGETDLRTGKHKEFVIDVDSFEPFAEIGDEVEFLICDRSGLALERLGLDGHIRASWAPDPFGRATDRRGPITNLRFAGQFHDSEIGLSYTRHRYFDHDAFAFISQDPLGFDAGHRPYAFGPNLLDWIDPYGLACEEIAAASRRDALNIAKDRLGVPHSQPPKFQFEIGGNPARSGHTNYVYRPGDPGSHGRYYVYDTPGGARVIADHTADPARGPHMHAGQPKGDATRRDPNLFKSERYGQVGGKHHINYPP